MTIGQRLKQELDRQHKSQKWLAQKSHVSEVSISRYMTDKRVPDIFIAHEITKALNRPLGWLVGEEEKKGKADVLDEIGAEIIKNSIEDYKYHGCGTDELIIETSEVLKIIDKYRQGD